MYMQRNFNECSLTILIISHVIIIYSDSIKTVVLIELTVHIEQNLADANLRKKCKYSELVA